MKTVVIGAGVVGSATAYALSLEGHDVVLLDRAKEAGTVTSLANGAQLSYSFVEPLASPSTLRALPAMLANPNSPLRFKLRADPRQWSWGLQFLRACNSGQVSDGTHNLLRLAGLSRMTLESWMKSEHLEFEFQRSGKLVLCPDEKALTRQAEQVRLQKWAGVEQEVLDRSGCLEREPALARYPDFVGGIWTQSECAGNPFLYCQALIRAGKVRGLDFLPYTEVLGLEQKGGAAQIVHTSSGPIYADAFVIAGGINSPALAKMVGEQVPIYPIKGYSVTLDMTSGSLQPRTNVTDLSQKMVLAPLNGRLRVAAMAEVVGFELNIPQDRIRQILAGVQAVYPDVCTSIQTNAWAGLRPATPTSEPIIRRTKISNVILNVGHGSLGFTLAAGSAAAVASLLRSE